MSAKTRFVLAVAILVLLMTGPFLLTAGIVSRELQGAEYAAFAAVMERRLPISGMLTLVALFLSIQLLRGLFKQYVRGLMAMAETLLGWPGSSNR